MKFTNLKISQKILSRKMQRLFRATKKFCGFIGILFPTPSSMKFLSRARRFLPTPTALKFPWTIQAQNSKSTQFLWRARRLKIKFPFATLTPIRRTCAPQPNSIRWIIRRFTPCIRGYRQTARIITKLNSLRTIKLFADILRSPIPATTILIYTIKSPCLTRANIFGACGLWRAIISRLQIGRRKMNQTVSRLSTKSDFARWATA